MTIARRYLSGHAKRGEWRFENEFCIFGKQKPTLAVHLGDADGVGLKVVGVETHHVASIAVVGVQRVKSFFQMLQLLVAVKYP